MNPDPMKEQAVFQTAEPPLQSSQDFCLRETHLRAAILHFPRALSPVAISRCNLEATCLYFCLFDGESQIQLYLLSIRPSSQSCGTGDSASTRTQSSVSSKANLPFSSLCLYCLIPSLSVCTFRPIVSSHPFLWESPTASWRWVPRLSRHSFSDRARSHCSHLETTCTSRLSFSPEHAAKLFNLRSAAR